MASTRQLKHHARMHAAVLRYLFPPSPPRSPRHSSALQEAVNECCEGNCFQSHPMNGSELVAEKKYSVESFVEEKDSDHDDETVGMDVRNALSSRARRKRLKLKKLKEVQSDVMSVKKFIGPSLRDVLEKTKHDESACTLRQDHSSPEKCVSLLNTEDKEDLRDGCESKPLSTASEEEKHVHTVGELESLYTEGWDVKDGHDGEEQEHLSKAKRRRLAKKRYQDNLQRRPLADSLFTAEIMGGDIVIKQMV